MTVGSVLACFSRKKKKIAEKFNFGDLKDKGRLHFFLHSPSSKLPIRDVLNQQNKGYKTEPHIEIGAENYIKSCYQSNIIHFLRSNEKYLFLFTTCKDKHHEYFNKKCIVGYILRKGYINNRRLFAVRGDIFICSFDDSLPISLLDLSRHIRVKCLDSGYTERILEHFKNKRNIVKQCVREIIDLDMINKKRNKTCKVLKGGRCNFKKECLRWKIGGKLFSRTNPIHPLRLYFN